MEPLQPGDPLSIDGYTLLARIGAGGMGRVYLGESAAGRHVAVKVIKPSVLDEDARARFIHEVDNLKTVYGPGVAAFVAADAHAEQPWLVVEYVHGHDLRTHVERHGPLPVAESASLGALLAEGIGTVHEAGLLHRDLKPPNILLAEYGPKVIDFGLAVLAERRSAFTATGFVVGSITCMPPEQARGEQQLNWAADVYALGAVLLYAATGHYPYTGTTWQATALKIEDPATAPDLSGLSSELMDPIKAMLKRDPSARPTLDEVTRMLVAVVHGHGLTAGQGKRRLADCTASDLPVLPDLGVETTSPPEVEYVPGLLDPAAQGRSELGTGPQAEAAIVDAGVTSERRAPVRAGHDPAEQPWGASGPRLPVPLAIAERMRAAYAPDARF
ncbi:serine/threonine-protein kinase [Embleya sp. NPDC008237]|uniref:serine/threonine-protein kinase n=1 Tax=Embleya sp. NPDC008237 TaxID=3363978 RepID=UPI0036EC2EEA